MATQPLTMAPLEWSGTDFTSFSDEQFRAISTAYYHCSESEQSNANMPFAVELPIKSSNSNRVKTIIFSVTQQYDTSTEPNSCKLKFTSFNWRGNQISTVKADKLSEKFTFETTVGFTLTRPKNHGPEVETANINHFVSDENTRLLSEPNNARAVDHLTK